MCVRADPLRNAFDKILTIRFYYSTSSLNHIPHHLNENPGSAIECVAFGMSTTIKGTKIKLCNIQNPHLTIVLNHEWPNIHTRMAAYDLGLATSIHPLIDL